MRIPPRPTVYEINTAVWLERLGRERGSALTLSEVPADQWDRLAALPVDAVWLMGVWRRSPTGVEIARHDEGVQQGNRAALPDLSDEDVIGSPYCVREYVVDDRFGGPPALAAARAALAERGIALILDYVPNHVAPDHPWITTSPGCLLSGTEQELAEHPEAFIATAGGVFANGRDPYFAPWRDVVQMNAFSRELRDAVAATLIDVGNQCDGLRCDMAMLMTNEVFARTWGERAGPMPETEYWPELIGRVRADHPDLLFMAEAYWDMEWTLQQQGFDLCYDKRLYDRLVHDPATAIRGHLQADPAYQERLIRFIENHDEPRAVATFRRGRRGRRWSDVCSRGRGSITTASSTACEPTSRCFSAAAPTSRPTPSCARSNERLMWAVADGQTCERARWQLGACTGWPDNNSAQQLIAWCWEAGDTRRLVVVNYADAPAQARIHLPWPQLHGEEWELSDQLSDVQFTRDGDELAGDGLYVGLDPWAFHFLAFEPGGAGRGRRRYRRRGPRPRRSGWPVGSGCRGSGAGRRGALSAQTRTARRDRG